MRANLWACTLAACLVTGPAAARPKPKPAPVAPAEPPPPVEVPPLVSTRPDGLRVVTASTHGPGVSVRLVVNLHDAKAHHAMPGVAQVTATTALQAGPAGANLAGGGARRTVEVVDDSLVVGMDTLRERWKDDLTAFLQALSSPALAQPQLLGAAHRVAPFGPSHNLDALFAQLGNRLDGRDPALAQPDAPADISLETAVWHLEETWVSDRMTLVVVGPVERAELDALVEANFLIPNAGRPMAVAHAPGTRLSEETTNGTGPSFAAYGQYSRDVPPADVLVLAQYFLQRVQEERPRATDCQVRYLPSMSEPALLLICAGVNGTALDVRETMTHAFAPATPPTPAQLKDARSAALGELQADNASVLRLARRLSGFAAAGLDGGEPLEKAVGATQDPALLASFTELTSPARAIRIHRRGREGGP